jgi:hypothetical protein
MPYHIRYRLLSADAKFPLEIMHPGRRRKHYANRARCADAGVLRQSPDAVAPCKIPDIRASDCPRKCAPSLSCPSNEVFGERIAAWRTAIPAAFDRAGIGTNPGPTARYEQRLQDPAKQIDEAVML